MPAQMKSPKSLKLFLSIAMIVPVMAMLVRVYEGISNEVLMPQSEVPFWALALHGGASVLFLMLGALQVLPGFRRRNGTLHQRLGRPIFAISFIGAISGLYVTLAWPMISGPLLYWARLGAGLFWLVALALALRAITQRDFASHGRWMLRAYGLALTAGTLPFLLLPFIAVFGEGHLLMEETLQVVGWVLNIWLIEKLAGRPRRRSPVMA